MYLSNNNMDFTMRCAYCSESKTVDCSEYTFPLDRIEVASKNEWYAHNDFKSRKVFFWCSESCELKYKRQKRIHLNIVGQVSR